MDFAESSRIVFTRIKKLEPENVSKIIGYILLQEPCEQEMIQLAVCSDVSLQDVVFKAKAELHELALKSAPSPIPPPIHLPHVNEIPFQLAAAAPFPPVSAGVSFRGPSPYWDHQQQQVLLNKNGSDFVPLGYSDSVKEFQSQQTQLFGLEEQMEQFSLGNLGFQNECYYPDAALSSLSGRANRGYNYLSEHPVKACHYFFNKGFCKHGSNCRYSHGLASEGYPQVYGHSSLDGGFIEDHVFSPGSLEKLELEIVELLKSRRGSPISIASLPMMYYEKYRKVLQADGYLTESQRHGKAGYSLTKLLARLKNSIRLIDRPHGQHAVILAEDASKYMDNRNERSDPGPIVSGSRQIYLTFPAESTFTEDDVSNYFSTYGPVEDVRIPCQQKRMFGFVTFTSADTVKMILEKGNPHFVCGARVLVKPYREKSKLGDRKYHERMEHPVYFPPHYIDMEPELHPVARGYEDSRFFRKQVMPEHQLAVELERRRLAELQFMRKPVANHHFYGPTYDNFKVPEDHLNFPSAERFGHLFDVLNNGSNAADRVKHAENNHNDQECEGLNLPDSPFATQRAGGISSVI